METYEHPAVLASYTIDELTADAAVCVSYGVSRPVVRPPAGPRVLPETGAGGPGFGASASGGNLLGTLAAGAALFLAGGYALRRAVTPEEGDSYLPLQLDSSVALAATVALVDVIVGALLTWFWLISLIPVGAGG